MNDQPETNPPANLASRDRRLVAALLDTLFLLILLVPPLYVAGGLKLLAETFRSGIEAKQSFGQQMIGVLAGLALYLLLNGYLLAKRGQTLGKRIVKTKVVDLAGNRPSFNRLVFIRHLIPNLVANIPIVGTWLTLLDVIFIFRNDHRCLHDHLAGTRVVNA